MIGVKFDGLSKLYKELDMAADPKALESAVGKACSLVQSAARLGAHVNTGELREKILTDVRRKGLEVHGEVYTNVPQGVYQEFGTGPEGESNHSGISPEVTPAYTLEPWWVHESQVDEADAEMYHWPSIETSDGKFYRIDGQEADPFMYPALKNNEDKIMDIISEAIRKEIGGIG